MDNINILLISSLFGILGGIISGVNSLLENKIRLGNYVVTLGVFGDALIGLGAGIAVLLVKTSDKFIDAAGIGTLAGLAGNRLLIKMMESQLFTKLESKQEKLETRLDKFEIILQCINEGEIKLHSKQLDEAENWFLQAFKMDPNHDLINLDLAKVYRHKADHENNIESKNILMEKSIKHINLAIQANPKYERAYYNRACYNTILKKDVKTIISDLREAIKLYRGNVDFIKTDSDFDPIRDNEEFITFLSSY